MEEEFWQTRWREQRIAFHENRPNDLLEQHVHRLDLNPGDRVFLPLCGKAVDLDWLADKQLQIVGVEFNQGAVEEVFARRGLTPEVGSFGALTAFQAANLILFVGDFFELTREMIGPIDAIYDRAALVALPDETRSLYVKTLPELTGSARQLLISYDYDQSQTEGPPFSVPNAEIERLYQDRYAVEPVASRAITGSLAKRCSGQENVLLLTGL